MGTWHLTDQFLFFTDRDTLLPLLLFSLLWNTAAPSQCFPGEGVFTSAQLYQRRAVMCWWEAGGFSTVFPLQGTPRVHGRTAEDCAGASTIACPSASAQMLLQENMEDPAGGGLYGVPGAFSQRVILGRLRSGWAAGLRYRAAWCRSSGRSTESHSTRENEQEGNRQQEVPVQRLVLEPSAAVMGAGLWLSEQHFGSGITASQPCCAHPENCARPLTSQEPRSLDHNLSGPNRTILSRTSQN